VANKLVILALILFSFSIFLPWVAQQYIFFTWGFPRRFLKIDLLFWSFMVRQDGEILWFGRFWFLGQRSVIFDYSTSWNGLYLGWALIFVLQILTVVYSIIYSLRLRVSERLREHHSAWLVILPLLTIVLAVCQMFIQNEMMYHDVGLNPIQPQVGFAIALLSTAILLVAVLKAPEQSHLKTISRAFKRTPKKTWLGLVLLSLVALPVVAELEARTGVSKEMTVEYRKDFDVIHENPVLWETHYNRISSLASFFGARVTYNRPEYAYCSLEVPIVSYGILAALLNGLGYWTGEPAFMHPNASE